MKKTLYKARRTESSRELDLHGRYPDEIDYLIQQELTICHAYHVQFLRIIYGRGDGILREEVLKKIPFFRNSVEKINIQETSVNLQLKSLVKEKVQIKLYKNKAIKPKTKTETETKDYHTEIHNRNRIRYIKRMERLKNEQ